MRKQLSFLLITLACLLPGWMAWGQEAPAPAQLDLVGCLQFALENSPQLASAKQDVALAKAGLGKALVASKPTITASATHTRMGPVATADFGGMTIDIGADRATQYGAALNYLLYSSGAVENNQRGLKRQVEAADIAYSLVERDLAYQVAQAYLAVLGARRYVVVAEENLALATQHRDIAKQRFDAGESPRFDVTRASVEVASAEQSLISARNGVELALAALKTAMHFPLTAGLEIADIPLVRPEAPTLEEALAIAANQRLELRQLALAQEAADYFVKVAKSGDDPSVALNSTYYRQSTGGLGSTDSNWTASIILTKPLYDGGMTREDTRAAKARLEQIKEQTSLAKAGINFAVQQGLTNLQNALAQYNLAEASVAQAREAHGIARLRYESGLGTQLEFNDARLALIATEQTLATAQYQVQSAQVALQQALGVDYYAQLTQAATPVAAGE